ncbi:MAG: S41 family peptidase [Blastomonas sp.]
MKRFKFGAALCLVASLAACGGGGSGGGNTAVQVPPTGGTPTPTPPTSNACSLSARQSWALAQMNEWYLFPETLPTNLNPANYSTVDDYIDALTATARAQGRDRFFTHLASIQEENAFFSSGASAGFGIRLGYDTSQNRVFVIETFENTPALTAGLDRSAEILAIGTSTANLQNVSAIMASQGPAGVVNALGPSTVGTTRVLRVNDASGTRNITLSKAEYDIVPVSTRYGAKIITDGARKVGYLNLRTFISTADQGLRSAFAQFRSEGVTEVIIDLRYNGGGLVSIAELFGDLLGRNRFTSDVFSFTTFRASKAQFNESRNFDPQAQSIAPTKIAFIGTGGTASASELVINAMIPYLNANAALVGTNTFGKPVGQIALDRPECDDRLRVVAFRTENADHQGDYYGGLGDVIQASCQAPDDISRPLGDAQEASVAAALDFLAGRPCTAIAGGTQTAQSLRSASTDKQLLIPERPTTAQREVPGTF